MANLSRQPRREVERFQDEISRVFENFFPFMWDRPSAYPAEWEPNVDVTETENEVIVEAELPGMKKEDVQVSLDDDTLVIRGERKREQKKEEGRYHSTERYYGSFYRSLKLPTNVQSENVEANFKDGVLEIVLPKREEVKAKKIDVRYD